MQQLANVITYKFFGILFLIILCSTGCDTKHSQNQISKEELLSAVVDKPIIYFGFITRYNPRIMYEEYQPIMDYLTSETPYRFEIKLGKTYEDAVKFLEEGTVQVTSLGAVTYLQANQKFGAIPIVKPVNKEGKPYYQSLIVVRQDSDIQDIKDLKGKTFAFASIYSTSGNLIPRYILAKAGIHLDNLTGYINLKHHDSVAKAVLSGKYDAGSLKDIIGYRYLPKGLRILAVSDSIPSVPIVVRKDYDPDVIQAMKLAFLKIDLSKTKFQEIVSDWNDEFRYGFVETSDNDYKNIRNMLNDIQRTCGSPCHPIK